MVPHVHHIVEVARAIDEGATVHAARMAKELCRPELLAGRGDDRLAHAFGMALSERLRGDFRATGNLYQQAAGPREMLGAFQLLVERTPLVRFGYLAANAALHRELRGEPSLHIVDVGIGRGAQWQHWLRGFDRGRGGAPRPRVRLTGIEVENSEEQLREVGRELTDVAASVGVPFEFLPRAGAVEKLRMIDVGRDETLGINAGFALHHVPDGDAVLSPGASRDGVLTRLRALAPRVLTLVEPDVEHNALPFPERVEEAFRHYRIVFDVFEELLARDDSARRILEQSFFAREVHNIVVGEGPARVERHERHAAWTTRMTRQGFVPVDMAPLFEALAEEVALEAPFSMQMNAEAVSLLWKGTPLVTASAWRCRGAAV